MNWQPIETYPIPAYDADNWYRSAPPTLLFTGGVVIGWYSYTQRGKGRWQAFGGIVHPTHWMPLPDPPTD